MAVGSAFIQLVPSIKGFHRDTRKLLAAEDVEFDVDLKPEIDPREVRRELDSAADKASGVGVKLKPEIDPRAAEREADSAARRASGKTVTLTPRLNTRNAETEADRLRNKLSGTVTMDVDIDDVGAEKSLLGLQKRLMSRRITIPVNVQTARAMAELAFLNTYINRTNRALLRTAAGATLAFGALTLLSGAASGIGGLASSLVAASGALLLMPGMAAAGAAAIGTLVVGFQGVGDTMSAIASGDAEKFRAALDNLAPPARGLFLAIWEVRDAFSELRKQVQGALFAGLAAPFREMTTAILPALNVGLTAIAGAFNGVAAAAMRFFAQAQTVADLGTLFGATATVVRNLGAAFVPILAILRDVGTVGAEVFASLTGGAAAVTQRWASFIATARETGQLRTWITNGITAFRDLFATLGNVIGILYTVFSAASVAGSSLFGVLRGLTGELLAMLRSAEGQHMLTTFFATLRATVSAALPGLRAIGSALVNMITAIGPALPALGTAFTALAVALAPVLTGFGEFVGAIIPPLSSFLIFAAPAIGALASGLLVAGPVIWAVVKAWQAWNAALAIWKMLGKANWITLIIVAVLVLIGVIIYAWNNFDWFRNAILAVWNAIVVAFQWAAGIIQAIWGAIVAAAQWAVGVYNMVSAWIGFGLSTVGGWFAWLGGVISVAWQAIVGAALWAYNVILKPTFDAIVLALSFVAAAVFTILVTPWLLAWNAISAAARWAYDAVLAPVFGWIGSLFTWLNNNIVQPIVGWIVSAWNWLCNAVRAGYDASLRITFDLVAAAANWLYGTVLRPVFALIGMAWQGLVAGIMWVYQSLLKPCWDALVALIRWVWGSVLAPIFGFIALGWRNLVTGIQLAYQTILKPCWDALVALFRWVWNSVLRPTFDAIGRGWRALSDGIRWVYDTIIVPVFDALKGAVHAVGVAFDNAVRWIGDLWRGIKSLLAKPVNFMINTVYTGGVKKAWDTVAGWLGIPGLPEVAPIPENKRGGIIGGYTPGRDTELSWVSGGESIMRPEWTRGVGRGWVDEANRVARTRGTRGVRELMATGINDGPIGGPRRMPATKDGVPAFAGGGHTWPRLWDIMRNQFPYLTKTSDFRPGDSGYHGRGQALDVATGQPWSRMRPAAQYIASTFPNSTELIHEPGFGIKNGRPFTYSAGTRAAHRNHIHWAMAGEPVPGEGGGGGIFDIVGMVVDWFVNTLMKPVADMAGDFAPRFGEAGMSGAMSKVPGAAIDAGVEWVKGLGDRIWDIATHALGALFGMGGGGGAGVERWRGVALQALKMTGQPLGMVDVLLRRMNQESGGDPNAINLWDSNAKKGTPSIGLMQTIQPTFDAHAFPGFNNIRAPLDNILASIRYTISRYGSLPAGYNRAGGYDSGGWLPPGLSATYNGTGKPEAILTAQQWDSLTDLAARGAGGSGTTITVNAPTNASPERIAASVDRHLTMFGRV